jgi:menaquinone reductase, multiheme cytochrome c subunit
MAENATSRRFQFPRWANYFLPVAGLGAVGGLFYVTVLVTYGFSPVATAVGYAPEQPVPYSHALHVGQLGLDCRYCHTTVDKAPFAAIPPTQTCMNCHTAVKHDSPRLAPVKKSWETGKSIEWIKIHDLPQYAYFNHQAHVNKGVGCVSCHGRIDQMEVVRQVAPLSMGWCLECHRAPEKHLRPKDQVTNMEWKATDHPLAKEKGETDLEKAQLLVGSHLKAAEKVHDAAYMISCSTCHR